jgi:hypothetical protein
MVLSHLVMFIPGELELNGKPQLGSVKDEQEKQCKPFETLVKQALLI